MNIKDKARTAENVGTESKTRAAELTPESFYAYLNENGIGRLEWESRNWILERHLMHDRLIAERQSLRQMIQELAETAQAFHSYLEDDSRSLRRRAVNLAICLESIQRAAVALEQQP